MELEHNSFEPNGSLAQGGAISQGETSVQGGVITHQREENSRVAEERPEIAHTEDSVDTIVQSANLQGCQLARDKSRRQIRQPSRYANADLVYYALNAEVDSIKDEPNSFTEAINSKESQNWLEAMDEEMNSLLKNKTWILVEKPPKIKLVGCKWLYKVKETVGQEEPY